MIILGIDPGTTRVGYAILKNDRGGVGRLLNCGLIETREKGERQRAELYEALKKIIARWHPQAISLEKLFFFKNQKTALSVAEARGVILLTAAQARLKVYEYTPLEIKKRVTGFGGADKKQVEKMVRLLLNVPQKVASDDVIDAIAAALAVPI